MGGWWWSWSAGVLVLWLAATNLISKKNTAPSTFTFIPTPTSRDQRQSQDE